MPPKKDAVAAPKKEGATGKDGATANANANDQLIPGFTAREQKFLAAALLSCTAPGKFNNEEMGKIMGMGKESARVAFVNIKKKAVAAHPVFATFMGGGSSDDTAAKPAAGKGGATKKKREADGDGGESGDAEKDSKDTQPKAPKKKRVKKEENTQTAGADEVDEDTIKVEQKEEVKEKPKAPRKRVKKAQVEGEASDGDKEGEDEQKEKKVVRKRATKGKPKVAEAFEATMSEPEDDDNGATAEADDDE